MAVTFENVVAAVQSGHRRTFETREEVAAVVAAADRGDVAIVPFQKHRIILAHSGIRCGIEKPKKLGLTARHPAA